MRNFDQWLATFQRTNRTYSYWVDFEKVVANANQYKVELNILNSLIGAADIESDFKKLISEYPKCLRCIPILLAVRELEIEQTEGVFNFSQTHLSDNSLNQYVEFMHKTGLFNIIQNRTIKNLFDYTVGVEVGLGSNARKNRGGNLMSKIVSDWFTLKGIQFRSEVSTAELERAHRLNLSTITAKGTASKRFDFVVVNGRTVIGVEVNFYNGGGSKLNETARSYKKIAESTKNIENFKFAWITDGQGWRSAKGNLKETFDVLENIFNINDLKTGAADSLFLPETA